MKKVVFIFDLTLFQERSSPTTSFPTTTQEPSDMVLVRSRGSFCPNDWAECINQRQWPTSISTVQLNKPLG